MTVITIPKILQDKLTVEGAEALVSIFNRAEDKSEERILEVAEGKFERRLNEEISSVRVEISQTKSEIIRWMFIFIVGQFWAIIGVLFAFFKK